MSKFVTLPLIVGVVFTAAIVLPIIFTLPRNIRSSSLVVATVSEGKVVGTVTDESGIFWGIPYARPPLGELRWMRPRDPDKFADEYWNATYKRPGCSQICDQPVEEYSCPHAQSEDCLYLNVWIPRHYLVRSTADDVVSQPHYVISPENTMALPVMLWLYGGNFRNGAGTCTLYDGRFMADRGDVIIVTTNYRVAQLGFLTYGTKGEESLGNFGLWDQIKTMEWIQNNIHNFGGDPTKITLFGQSAGAESIAIHMTSSPASSLFHQAILQSNPFGLPFRTLDDARQYGNIFGEKANCTDLACLRSLNLDELEAAYNETLLLVTDKDQILIIFQPWGPIIDDEIVTNQPINLFRKNQQQKKPLLIGSTVDEGMIFISEAFPEPMSSVKYLVLLEAVFKPDDAAKILQRYPACTEADCDNRLILNQMVTEYIFFCPQRLALKSSSNVAHEHFYVFNQTWSFKEAWEEPLCYERVCHAAELAYLFNVENLTTYTYTNEERALSRRMLEYWTNFAKYGSPNGPQVKETADLWNNIVWPSFKLSPSQNPTSYRAIQFAGSGDFVDDNPYSDVCAFWDELDAYADH